MSARTRAPGRAAIWAALLSVYLIWGSTYLAIRFAVETMPPFLFAGVRFLIAGAVLYVVRRALGDSRPTPANWGAAAIVGLCLLFLGNGGVVWAEQTVASGVVALLIGTTPLWIVTVDWLRPRGHRPHPRVLLGVLVGFGGVALLVAGNGSTGGARIDPVGAVVVIFATLAWAVGSLYSRSAPLPTSPLLGTSMEMLSAGAALLLLGTATGEWARVDPAGISSKSLLALAYLIVFGAWIAFASYGWLLRNAPTPLVATYAYVNPVVAVVLGNLLAAEPITARVLIAAAIILGSVALTTAGRYGRASARPAGASPVETIAGDG